MMLPYLKGNIVHVSDRKLASTLINKGDYGRPQNGGMLELSLMEAAYLLSCERIEVKDSRNGQKMEPRHIIEKGIDLYPGFLQEYLVFQDIRNRGINIQGGDDRIFLSYPRGKRPGKGRADRWIMVYREHDTVKPGDLLKEADKREGMNMEYLAAVVDGDWDLTYYSIKSCTWKQRRSELDVAIPVQDGSLKEIPGGGSIVWGDDLVGFASDRGMGSDLSGSRLLSSHETNLLSRQTGSVDMKTVTYRDLTSRGFLVRTGFKYGTHFRVYTSGTIDDHSDLLVHCIETDSGFTWEELSRAIRLSHSVRKRMIFSIKSERGPKYLEIEWTRP